MIWLIGYLIIGVIVGLSFYAYECWRFKNSNYWKDWNTYFESNNVDDVCFTIGIFWFVFIFVGILYFITTAPAKCIRKYFGIE